MTTLNEYIDAPCGCPACNDGVLQGHFACSQSPLALIAWERNGEAWRAYASGAWRWFVDQDLMRVIKSDPTYIANMSARFAL